jgi:hypothetical protein
MRLSAVPRTFAILFCALLLPTVASPQATTIVETVRQLRAIEVPEFPSTDVPTPARVLLTQLKHQLRDLIAKTLNDPSKQTLTPGEIRAVILDRLQSEGVELKLVKPGIQVGTDVDIDKYGLVQEIRMEHPSGQKELLAAVTTLQIPCGQDSSFYIFQHIDAGWKLILTQEANNYDQINGAQGSFDYAVSPADHAGNWFAVAVDINPWCTSVWQGIRYKVLRVGPTPDEPVVVLSRHEGVNLNFEPAYKLSIGNDGFRLLFGGGQNLDMDLMLRVHVANYAVAGNRATRVPPIALLPQDFLDEWVELPWEEASKWTAAAPRADIQSWHSRVHRSERADYVSNFAFVQPCGDSKRAQKWQIGLKIGVKDRPPGLPDELYFIIVRKVGAFYLQSIDAVRPPGCPGETRAVSTLGVQLP